MTPAVPCVAGPCVLAIGLRFIRLQQGVFNAETEKAQTIAKQTGHFGFAD